MFGQTSICMIPQLGKLGHCTLVCNYGRCAFIADSTIACRIVLYALRTVKALRTKLGSETLVQRCQRQIFRRDVLSTPTSSMLQNAEQGRSSVW